MVSLVSVLVTLVLVLELVILLRYDACSTTIILNLFILLLVGDYWSICFIIMLAQPPMSSCMEEAVTIGIIVLDIGIIGINIGIGLTASL